MLPSCHRTLAEAIPTTIWPEFKVPTDILVLYARDYSTKIYSFLSFNLSTCMTIWPKIRVAIDFFYVHATIRPKHTVLFHLFFLLCTTIPQKYMVFFHLLFLLCTTIGPKIKVNTDLFLYRYTTIRRKVRVLINLFTLFLHDHSTKN